MNSAATAAKPTTMAPIHTAGTSPATYACGVKYDPFAVKIAARTATPNTPPTSRIALLAPDALPSSSGRTADRTTLAMGAKNMPMPTPLTMNGRTNAEYGASGAAIEASQPRPTDIRARPVATIGRAPMRPLSTPAMGATTIGMAVHGRTRRPASNGLTPCTTWKNCESRKIDPNIPKYMSRDAMFAAGKPRLRNMSGGSIGWGGGRPPGPKPNQHTP